MPKPSGRGGRPPIGDKARNKSRVFRLTPDEDQQLTELAEGANTSRSALVRQALSTYLKASPRAGIELDSPHHDHELSIVRVIRLTTAEDRLLTKRVELEGTSISTVIRRSLLEALV